MGIRWQFVEKEHGDDVRWSWRALHPDGTLRSSPHPLPSYGAAVHDAIRHGFMPAEHDWSVTSGRSIVQYYFRQGAAVVQSRRPTRRTARPDPAPPSPPPLPGPGIRRRR